MTFLRIYIALKDDLGLYCLMKEYSRGKKAKSMSFKKIKFFLITKMKFKIYIKAGI